MGVFLGTRERVRNSRGKRPMMNPIYITATMKNYRVASPESVPIPLRAERISVLIRPRGYKKMNVKFISGKNSILGLSQPKKAEFLDIFILMSI